MSERTPITPEELEELAVEYEADGAWADVSIDPEDVYRAAAHEIRVLQRAVEFASQSGLGAICVLTKGPECATDDQVAEMVDNCTTRARREVDEEAGSDE